MKKIPAAFFACMLLCSVASAQNNTDQKDYIGVSFLFNDFVTAERIRATSTSNVIGNDQWAKFNEMSAGIGVHYFRGLKKHIDFAATATASFARDAVIGKKSSDKSFLLEVDASALFKFVPDTYLVVPYASAGLGATLFQNRFGSIIPLGLGLRINLDNTMLFTGAQYRIPVSVNTNNYHFMYHVGIASRLGN
ncbi:MAG TPA: hypothetical protein VFZ78_09200 [Flavisolibacter sp.]